VILACLQLLRKRKRICEVQKISEKSKNRPAIPVTATSRRKVHHVEPNKFELPCEYFWCQVKAATLVALMAQLV
jgi:hypothetical protein